MVQLVAALLLLRRSLTHEVAFIGLSCCDAHKGDTFTCANWSTVFMVDRNLFLSNPKADPNPNRNPWQTENPHVRRVGMTYWTKRALAGFKKAPIRAKMRASLPGKHLVPQAFRRSECDGLLWKQVFSTTEFVDWFALTIEV